MLPRSCAREEGKGLLCVGTWVSIPEGPACWAGHFIREPLTLRGGCIPSPPPTPTLRSQLVLTSPIRNIDYKVTFGKLKSFFALELYAKMRGLF